MKRALASNDDFSGPPVDVIESEGYHLAGAETETGQQKKNGVVAAAGRGATIAGFEYTVDFFPGQVLGHGGEPPISHPGHRSGQVDLQFPFLKQEAEERAESRGHQLGCSDSHTVAMPQNKI